VVVGILQVELTIPPADSLKAKRMVIRCRKDRICNDFNVYFAEVEENDQWQSAVLAVAIVSNDKRFANQVLYKVVDFTGKSRDLVLDDYRVGFL
jgi:uncharacterized protein